MGSSRKILQWLAAAVAVVVVVKLLDYSGALRAMRAVTHPEPAGEQLHLVETPTQVALPRAPDYYKLKVNNRIGTLLNAALEAAKAERYVEAMRKANEARSRPGASAYDLEKTDEVLAYLYMRQKKLPEGAAAYERLIESKIAPPEVRVKWLHTATQVEFVLRNYAKAIDIGQRALAIEPDNEDMMVMVGQSHYLLRDYAASADCLEEVSARRESSGEVPSESHLLLLVQGYSELKQNERLVQTLKRLMKLYPKPDYQQMLTAMGGG